MSRTVFIVFLSVFLFSFITLTFAERGYSNISPKSEVKPDIYAEYKKAQDALWNDYQEIRNKLIDDYLSGKSGMSYEDFKSKERSLMDIYANGRDELLRKYLNTRNNKGKMRIPHES